MRHLTLRISDGAFVPSYLRTWSVEIPHSEFRTPHWSSLFVLSYLRTLLGVMFIPHSELRIPHLTGTSDLSPAVAIANYQGLTPFMVLSSPRILVLSYAGTLVRLGTDASQPPGFPASQQRE
jgi:hypothetical protein